MRRRADDVAASANDLVSLPESAERSIPELVRSIATDTSTLVRKEMELARQEIVGALTARIMGAGAMAAAGLLGLFALAFLALAVAAALDNVLRPWASRLIVGGGFLLLAAVGTLFGVRKMKKPPLAPTETKRTVREDVQWARRQLKR
jgi:putative superfamily III holin-X